MTAHPPTSNPTSDINQSPTLPHTATQQQQRRATNSSTNDTATNTATNGTTTVRELRVAQTELRSGNRTGRVFSRLSAGAVAFPVSRKQAETEISSRLRTELLRESPSRS